MSANQAQKPSFSSPSSAGKLKSRMSLPDFTGLRRWGSLKSNLSRQSEPSGADSEGETGGMDEGGKPHKKQPEISSPVAVPQINTIAEFNSLLATYKEKLTAFLPDEFFFGLDVDEPLVQGPESQEPEEGLEESQQEKAVDASLPNTESVETIKTTITKKTSTGIMAVLIGSTESTTMITTKITRQYSTKQPSLLKSLTSSGKQKTKKENPPKPKKKPKPRPEASTLPLQIIWAEAAASDKAPAPMKKLAGSIEKSILGLPNGLGLSFKTLDKYRIISPRVYERLYKSVKEEWKLLEKLILGGIEQILRDHEESLKSAAERPQSSEVMPNSEPIPTISETFTMGDSRGLSGQVRVGEADEPDESPRGAPELGMLYSYRGPSADSNCSDTSIVNEEHISPAMEPGPFKGRIRSALITQETPVTYHTAFSRMRSPSVPTPPWHTYPNTTAISQPPLDPFHQLKEYCASPACCGRGSSCSLIKCRRRSYDKLLNTPWAVPPEPDE